LTVLQGETQKIGWHGAHLSAEALLAINVSIIEDQRNNALLDVVKGGGKGDILSTEEEAVPAARLRRLGPCRRP